jgi:transcription elongation factor Elf1
MMAVFYSCPVCSELQEAVVKFDVTIILKCKSCDTISEIKIYKGDDDDVKK